MSKREAHKMDQAELGFDALVSDVTPLRARNRAMIQRPRPLPVAEQRLRDERETLKESLSELRPWDRGYETGDELLYARPGVSSQTVRKLRRGHWSIQRVLDLHGYTVVEARAALIDFLAACRREEIRCARIIHGKGLGSRNREPVLKRKIAVWLMQKDEVLAYCQARRTEGGGGAVVVLLKS